MQKRSNFNSKIFFLGHPAACHEREEGKKKEDPKRIVAAVSESTRNLHLEMRLL
jgi:hypothetical protein